MGFSLPSIKCSAARPSSGYCRALFRYTLFFFIRTSNFDAEAERSYIFWRFEAETFLKMFLNLPGIVFQPISADVTDTRFLKKT